MCWDTSWWWNGTRDFWWTAKETHHRYCHFYTIQHLWLYIILSYMVKTILLLIYSWLWTSFGLFVCLLSVFRTPLVKILTIYIYIYSESSLSWFNNNIILSLLNFHLEEMFDFLRFIVNCCCWSPSSSSRPDQERWWLDQQELYLWMKYQLD